MKTETCSIAFPFPNMETFVEQIWNSRGTLISHKRDAVDLVWAMMTLNDVQLNRLPHLLRCIPQLQRKVAASVLDMVLEFIGWLVAVNSAHPHAHSFRYKIKDGTKVLEVDCIEECRHCRGEMAVIPAKYPEFCGHECALEWMNQHARDLHKVEELDDLIERAKEEGVKEGEKVAQETIWDAVTEAMDGEENNVLEIIRRHLMNSTLSMEEAAWRLESALMRGSLIL